MEKVTDKDCGAAVAAPVRLELSAMAVVFCRERILTTTEMIYGKETLSLPKGHKEAQESLIETAIRECREETGVSIDRRDLVRELPSYHYDFSTPSGQLIRKVIVPFLFEVESEEAPVPQESRIVSVQWMDKTHFLASCSHDQVKAIVQVL